VERNGLPLGEMHAANHQNRQESKMKNLFVGNMSFHTSEGELTELFQAFGQVTRVHMATDRETGRARGFAFVEMANDAEAVKAIAGLDGKDVGGRSLKVSEARPKAERRPQHGSGSRGGGGSSTEDYRESSRQPREPRW
jgi:RNA recognition motif-containing protein